MPWGCWIEPKTTFWDIHHEEWECMIGNFTQEEANTTVHRIYGQWTTLSVNYKPGDWGSVRAWVLKAGSSWHQAELPEDLQNMPPRNKYAAGSLGAVTTHCITKVGTLGPVSGGANAKVAASVASGAYYRCWAQEGLPSPHSQCFKSLKQIKQS